MEKTLSQLHDELDKTTTRAHDLFKLPDDRFTSRPPTGKWSIAENISHLTLINTDYLHIINDALAANAQQTTTRQDTSQQDTSQQGSDQQGSDPYELGFVGKWFTRLMEPPVRFFKMPTTKGWTPNIDTLEPQAIKDGFLAAQAGFGKSLEASQGWALDKITAASPESKYIKLSMVEMYAILLAHNRRHLWISEQLTHAE